ncbi:helix-turn-helix transcriptional regulator [Marivirga atlantica]|jgi:putative transcriptional regulator|uniref:Helix-turn-helix transcriptional regulator n=1 Tax=Marivirga atlantica TaxID=1548457 RepID=A0A937DHM7_9BACT|nr:helix-turn-helix transcriptional regulator [Marivirga atlantica]MBL0764165.1 helix-turn-helix transcriptional regulator [Marivirga atlantica]
MPIIINLDVVMAKRKMSLTELSEKVGVSMTNLSLLKKGHVKGIRFNTLEAICEVLECKPGDIIDFEPKSSSNE